MELKEIEAIFDKFEKSCINEMELEADNYRLFLKKQTAPAASASYDIPKLGVVPDEAAKEEKANTSSIKAPLVGTFYRASAPGAEPYIKVGDHVKKGDVIGLIEAMKFMNEITASCDGTVVDIPASDGSFVAFDEELVILSA